MQLSNGSRRSEIQPQVFPALVRWSPHHLLRDHTAHGVVSSLKQSQRCLWVVQAASAKVKMHIFTSAVIHFLTKWYLSENTAYKRRGQWKIMDCSLYYFFHGDR